MHSASWNVTAIDGSNIHLTIDGSNMHISTTKAACAGRHHSLMNKTMNENSAQKKIFIIISQWQTTIYEILASTVTIFLTSTVAIFSLQRTKNKELKWFSSHRVALWNTLGNNVQLSTSLPMTYTPWNGASMSLPGCFIHDLEKPAVKLAG